MIALAIALSVLVGMALGLLGGGGSILMVPILRYTLGMEAHRAIALSLLVGRESRIVRRILGLLEIRRELTEKRDDLREAREEQVRKEAHAHVAEPAENGG
jgi:hypothetical protein